MKGLFGRLAAVVLALGIVTTPLAAQIFQPNYVGGDGMGVTANADFGYGVNNASGKEIYLGGRATIGVGMIVINAGAGYGLDKTKAVSFGGNAAANFLSLPGSPLKVGVYAGAAYFSKSGVNQLTVPAGAIVTISPPSPSIGFDVWLAPGIRYIRVGGLLSGNTTKFGGSAGININMPAGFGFHVAADYTNISGGSPLLVGGGLHYKFGM